MNNKTKEIIAIVLIVLVLGALYLVYYKKRTGEMSQNQNQAVTSIPANTDKVKQINQLAGSGAKYPTVTKDFPQSLLPDNVKISGSMAQMFGGDENNTTAYQTSQSVKQVYDFYKKLLSQDHTVKDSYTSRSANLYAVSFQNDVAVSISKGKSGTNVTVSYVMKGRK